MINSVDSVRPHVPVLYTDFDGTVRHGLNELNRFVNTAEDVVIFDGVPDLLRAYQQLGWRIAGCTNQGGIALGHMTYKECVENLQETQKQAHGVYDTIVFCPHHPEAEDPVMQRCWCRKPKAGLVAEAAAVMSVRYHELYPASMAIFVGDRPEDQACAEAAGIEFWDAETWRQGAHLERIQ